MDLSTQAYIQTDTHKIMHIPFQLIKSFFKNSLVSLYCQRDPTIEHTMHICEYIKSNYNHPTFYLGSPIIISGSAESHYKVVDGQHRCYAIYELPLNHPSLQNKIEIHLFENLTEKEEVELFRRVNSSRPMSEIYLRDNCKETMIQNIKTRLERYYEIESVEEASLPCYNIIMQHIKSSFTAKNYDDKSIVQELFKTHITMDLVTEELFRIITDLNDLLDSIIGQALFSNNNTFTNYISTRVQTADIICSSVINAKKMMPLYKILCDILRIVKQKPPQTNQPRESSPHYAAYNATYAYVQKAVRIIKKPVRRGSTATKVCWLGFLTCDIFEFYRRVKSQLKQMTQEPAASV